MELGRAKVDASVRALLSARMEVAKNERVRPTIVVNRARPGMDKLWMRMATGHRAAC